MKKRWMVCFSMLLPLIITTSLKAEELPGTYQQMLVDAQASMVEIVGPTTSLTEVSQALADNVYLHSVLITVYGRQIAEGLSGYMATKEALDPDNENTRELDVYMDVMLSQIMRGKPTAEQARNITAAFITGDHVLTEGMGLQADVVGKFITVDPRRIEDNPDDCILTALRENPYLGFEELALLCAGPMGGGGGGDGSGGDLPAVSDPCKDFLREKGYSGVEPPSDLGDGEASSIVGPDPDPDMIDHRVGEEKLSTMSAEEICKAIKMSMAKFSAGDPDGKINPGLLQKLTVSYDVWGKTWNADGDSTPYHAHFAAEVTATEKKESSLLDKLFGSKEDNWNLDVKVTDTTIHGATGISELHDISPDAFGKLLHELEIRAYDELDVLKSIGGDGTVLGSNTNFENVTTSTGPNGEALPIPVETALDALDSKEYDPEAIGVFCDGWGAWVVAAAMCAEDAGEDECGAAPDGEAGVSMAATSLCCNGHINKDAYIHITQYADFPPDFDIDSLCVDVDPAFGWSDKQEWIKTPERTSSPASISEQFHGASAP